jgi:uncharacterized protein
MVTERAFADSSALVKRYIGEDDDTLIRGLDELTVSALAGVEVASAIWRRASLGHVDPAEAELALERLDEDLRGGTAERPGYGVIRPSEQVLRSAAEMVRSHSLRALDAIQLASALMARELIPECTTFACFDVRLRAAAADHGFALVPA